MNNILGAPVASPAKMKSATKIFTLIEVLIALSILSLSVVTFLMLMGSASKRTNKAAQRWENTHLLTQAVEYYMLNKPGSGSIDERFFPLDEYNAECSFDSPQGLPDGVEESADGQTLVAMRVVIKDKDDKTLDSMIVERIIGDLDK
jgi:type II secretory pathway pseudopilin PulG